MWEIQLLIFIYTGCNSGKWKKVQANILKEPLVLLKQTIPQQKALDLSFNFAPWKWAWQYHEASTPSCPKRSQKPSAPTYAFHSKEVWRPPDDATPTFRGAKLKLRSRAFCWHTVCFCTSNGSFRILKKAGGNFLKKIISVIS
jgi:hypothetical protein